MPSYEKPARSKLQVHAGVIAELQRKRRSYREISVFFRDNLAITVAPNAIHGFVRVRRRRENEDWRKAGSKQQRAIRS